MNKLCTLLVFCIASTVASAQSYPIGTLTTTYTDASRSNRSVPVEIHYPAVAAGASTNVANGAFPFVVFGHGFQMTAPAYYPFADSLAQRGYIVAFANTENSFSPSHADFAKDLLFIYSTLIAENGNSSSPFSGHVLPRGAIGGHSMGGGATVLSAQYGDSATCYFTFAEATTNPSSITAAQYLTKPYLSFAGSYDCIAPYSTNQLPTYNAAASSCKWLIEITGASHCNFGLSNAQCSIGETFSGCSNPPLNQSAQISTVLTYLYPYLDHYLMGDTAAQSEFQNVYDTDNNSNKMSTCAVHTGIPSLAVQKIDFYPNPVRSIIHVDGEPGVVVQISDMYGHTVRYWTSERTIDLSAIAPGVYIMQVGQQRVDGYIVKIIKE